MADIEGIVVNGSSRQRKLVGAARRTLRDQFAMAALQGLLANPESGWTTAVTSSEAYKIADAMMKARAR